MNGTTARMTATTSTVRMMPLEEVCSDWMIDVGRPAMMLAKMMRLMPLPMPRWVMTSPIHMMRMAPASMDTTTTMSMRASGRPDCEKSMPKLLLLNRKR